MSFSFYIYSLCVCSFVSFMLKIECLSVKQARKCVICNFCMFFHFSYSLIESYSACRTRKTESLLVDDERWDKIRWESFHVTSLLLSWVVSIGNCAGWEDKCLKFLLFMDELGWIWSIFWLFPGFINSITQNTISCD